MLTRSRASVCDLQFDPEIEGTARRLRKETRKQRMAEAPRTLQDYFTPTADDAAGGISVPAVEANNFELKPALINMIQNSLKFGGSPSEDPNLHLRKFLRLTDTIKYNGVTTDAIRLRLFPFSVTETVNEWFSSLPANSIGTWDQLTQQFLGKYFPPARSAKLIADITSYKQADPSESLYEAWERFKDLLRRCPHHGFPVWRQLQLFYNGLSFSNRSMIDAACGGTIVKKSSEEAYNLINEMAASSCQWQPPEQVWGQRKQVIKSDPLADQVMTLSKQIETLMKAQGQLVKPAPECEHCGSVSHDSNGCPVGKHWAKQQEEVNYMGNGFSNNLSNSSGNRGSGWPNNFSGSGSNFQGGQNSNAYRPPHLQNQ